MEPGPLIAEAQVDGDDYLIDLNAETGVDGDDFDFRLDGVFDDAAVNATMEGDDEVANGTGPDFDIGFENEENQNGVEEEHAAANIEPTELGAEVGIEYQDEIGYEDEESAVPEDTNTAAEEIATSNLEQSVGVNDTESTSKDVLRHETPTDEDGQGEIGHECNDIDEETQQDAFGDHDEDVSHGDQSSGPSAESSRHPSHIEHEETVTTNTGDLENHASDDSDTSSTLPEIVVHYNQGQYSLVGSPNDDPDTYFLSDEKDLDGSLSQLLALIRSVLSDELSAGDELRLRIDSLDFEFGEKSSQRFLNRPFRDIISCYAALAANPSRLAPRDSSTLDLELLVRRDCEEHFLELLSDAGLAKENTSQFGEQEDYEGVEDTTFGDHGHESSMDGYSEGYELGNDVKTDEAAVDMDGDMSQEINEEEPSNFEEPVENVDDSMGDAFDLELGMAEPVGMGSPEAVDDESAGQDAEYQHAEYHGYEATDRAGSEEKAVELEMGDNGVDTATDFEGEFPGGMTNEETEFAVDVADMAAEEGVSNNDWAEEAGIGGDIGVGEVSTDDVVGATTEQGSTPYDDDFALATDSEFLATTTEQGGHATLAPDAETGQMNGSYEINSTFNGDDYANRHLSTSHHTSRTSTINGDETQAPSDEHSLVSQTSHQTTKPVGNADEISWENDADEEEGQDGPDETSNSVSGKRGRTNEPESLEDEADYKRRRT